MSIKFVYSKEPKGNIIIYYIIIIIILELNDVLLIVDFLYYCRLEQPYFNISSQFLSSLGNAIKLERLCIIAKDGTFAPFKAALLFKQVFKRRMK